MATMIYRLEIPGFRPARWDSRAAALAFWKFAAPSVTGKGLYAKLWIGKRDESGSEIWTFAPRLIEIDEKDQIRRDGPSAAASPPIRHD